MITNIQLQNAKPRESDYTIKVDTGLSLLVKASGSKLWRFRYSHAGKRCMMSLGKYPHVGIKQARDKTRDFHELLEQGINPSTQKKIAQAKQAMEKNFQTVALEWYAKHYGEGNRNERYNKLVLRRLEKYAFPAIGNLPIRSIEAPMMFNLVESIQQDDGFIVAGRRVNEVCSMVFRYGVAKGYCTRDVTQDYRGMLKSNKPKHLPTLTDPDDIGELLRDIHAYSGRIVLRTAMLVSAYVFVRPSELANSEWSFIDWDSRQWLIPARLMKMKRDHLVPMSSQVAELLLALHSITGDSPYIFPNSRDPQKPMHSEIVNKMMRKMLDEKWAGRIVAHGFRGMASTILNENRFRPDVIERQLAHLEKNKIRGAYNHAEYLPERTEMMQWYADHLDSLAANSAE